MCGIAGILRYANGQPLTAEVIARMTRALAHRGPDGEGVHVDDPIALGHRRLSIIDLTDAGRQPMANADGRLWITYNGELFNFRELRAELTGQGARFRSESDTEVILAAYRRWGRACLERFNGMFAFGLWDADDRSLWLVRDRLGVKPLFYADADGWLSFASEIKGVLPALRPPPQLDPEALSWFLSFNYTPAPATCFRGIRQLLPGHWLLARPDRPVQLQRYWSLPTTLEPGRHADRRLAELLDDAVRLRLVADVEVGAFLSGGLDSSAVVAWMRRHTPGPIKTFTASFTEATYDEAPHARRVAKALGTTHHDQSVSADDLECLPKLVWHSEELTADSSMLALYRVAERARRDVKVVLTGDGADELFGGYPTYLATRLARWYRRIPQPVRHRVIRPAVATLPVSGAKASLESRLRRFVNADVRNVAAAHASWRTIFSRAEQQSLQRDVPWQDPADLYQPLVREGPPGDLVNRLLRADLQLYLPNDMLVKVDRMTMAWGLEARTPYLDYRVVEFAAQLPSSVTCAGGVRSKQLLRRAVRDLLPPAVRARRKAGFSLPHAAWFRDPRRTVLERHLLDARPSVFALFDRAQIERLIRDHRSGRRDGTHQLWGLVCLSLWSQQFLDGGRRDR